MFHLITSIMIWIFIQYNHYQIKPAFYMDNMYTLADAIREQVEFYF